MKNFGNTSVLFLVYLLHNMITKEERGREREIERDRGKKTANNSRSELKKSNHSYSSSYIVYIINDLYVAYQFQHY